MANEESPLFRDIFFSSTAPMADANDDSLLDGNLIDVSSPHHDDLSMDPFSLIYAKEEGIEIEAMSADPFLSDSSFEFLPTFSMTSSSPSILVSSQQSSDQKYTVPMDCSYHLYLSLSFINPPEPTYHVRYLSEITNAPLDGNMVNTKKKTKKNVSGRYLKGTHGRHVTIALPPMLPESPNLHIRVTRLTVPHQDVSYIHPYPLLYSPPKKKAHSDVIIEGSSIYYKLNKEEICSRSKRFPNLILTRLKQCHLKQISSLRPFDDREGMCPFVGDSVKSKIAAYQLKKSQLDFRLLVRCEKTGEFFDANISCRSNALLEEEGTDCKKASISSCG